MVHFIKGKSGVVAVHDRSPTPLVFSPCGTSSLTTLTPATVPSSRSSTTRTRPLSYSNIII
ncbi:HTH-type transcriptional activator IlvY [Sesbania bispinosa]|nr:HTH-type transcriptional activator IlvY [Sesbania bispinosa]